MQCILVNVLSYVYPPPPSVSAMVADMCNEDTSAIRYRLIGYVFTYTFLASQSIELKLYRKSQEFQPGQTSCGWGKSPLTCPVGKPGDFDNNFMAVA